MRTVEVFRTPHPRMQIIIHRTLREEVGEVAEEADVVEEAGTGVAEEMAEEEGVPAGEEEGRTSLVEGIRMQRELEDTIRRCRKRQGGRRARLHVM